MGVQVIESFGSEVPARRTWRDPHGGHELGISATARTDRSVITAIRADIGESEAYKQALLRGEIGLQRPMGANVRGVDFITAVLDGKGGIKEIICSDVKTSVRGAFPTPKQTLPGDWRNEVKGAVGRLKLRVVTTDVTSTAFPVPHAAHSPADLARLEQQIVDALAGDRIRLRQLNANYSSAGQGIIVGW